MVVKPSLDIILPCYNPILGWDVTIIKFFSEIRATLLDVEIKLIVIDDGSRNNLLAGIEKIKNELPCTILYNKINRGKGYAVRKGVECSQADYIIYTDVDFPYTTASFCKLYNSLLDFDVVLGVRDNYYYNEIPSSRKRISILLKTLNKRLMKVITADTQCGLKGISKRAKIILLETREDRYLFDLEFVKLLSKRADIKTNLEIVKLREGVTFSKVPITKIAGEMYSYLKILVGR